MILDVKGTLYAFGSPEYGQLGNNTDGKRLVRANKITLDYVLAPIPILVYVEKNKRGYDKFQCNGIVDFACGANHTVSFFFETRSSILVKFCNVLTTGGRRR